MNYTGNLKKMTTQLEEVVKYSLTFGDQTICLNELIGQEIEIEFTGTINCINCGKVTKKSFAQGFCFQCMKTAPQADESILRPELSMAQYGFARDLAWAEKHDLVENIVYLAVSDKLKVGVTRHHQVPTRWIDQGADRAIVLARTPNRHIAGCIEVFLKKQISDKTSWQKMLKNEVNQQINLMEEKERVANLLPQELKQYVSKNDEIIKIHYPHTLEILKVKSLSLEKMPLIREKLQAIKGQYLIFEGGKVFNVRSHTGYQVKIKR